MVTGIEPTTTGGTGETTIPDFESRTGTSMRGHARRQASCDMVSFDELKSEFLPEEFNYRPGLLAGMPEVRYEDEGLSGLPDYRRKEKAAAEALEVKITETLVTMKPDVVEEEHDNPDEITREKIPSPSVESKVDIYDITISLEAPKAKRKKFSTISFLTPSHSSSSYSSSSCGSSCSAYSSGSMSSRSSSQDDGFGRRSPVFV